MSLSACWSDLVANRDLLRRYPPFVSYSRHVTRRKILNWKDTLNFPPPPPRPHVSHEGINLMRQQPCESEDRLDSQSTTSVSRPNTRAIHALRSGFLSPPLHAGDGAERPQT